MDPDRFVSPLWWHALTLAERGAALLGDQAVWTSPNEDSERGRRRLERWRSQAPFAADPLFEQRLALDGIHPEQILPILSVPVESLQSRFSQPPAWLAQLKEAFCRPVSAPGGPAADPFVDQEPVDEVPDPFAPDDLAPDDEIFGLLEIVRPLVADACDRLQTGIAALVEQGGALPFDPATIEDVLLMNLADPLLMRLSRTLVLELHVARLQGVLEGDTSQARFQSFVERLRQPEHAVGILAEYPVLACQLTLCINQWTAVGLEFLNRLCADWELIRSRFCPDEDPGELVELSGGAGDTHRGGRSVMIAEFASGFRLVYKPKSLAMDVHFQDVVAWLNQLGCDPPLYILSIMDRGEYGWVEYIARQDCESGDEIVRFYQRQGAYLALLYALNANDFHFENLIAMGEHPVLIDLETLIQPQFDTFDETRAGIAVAKVMADSVMQVGLLPARMWSGEEFAGIDISGLGGAPGQLSPDRLPRPTDVGTDTMRYVRERVALSGASHRPTLHDVEVGATDYVDDVVAGFSRTYRLLMDARAELVREDGLLSRFAQDEIRVLLRQTRTYDQLLYESFHPDMLRDALERDRFLDRLWIAVPQRAYLGRVVKAEQIDLQQGDIPIFMSRPSSRDLFSAAGERIDGFLVETGVEVVQRRLQRLSEQDLQRQEWCIRASFAMIYTNAEQPARPAKSPPDVKTPVTRARLLAGAAAIADHLAATAVHGADDVSWLGLELLDEENWTIQSLGIDLYGGIAGIALFLAYAGAILHEDRHTALARRTLKALTWQMEVLRTEMSAIGGYDGWGGVLYALTHLGALWDDQTVLTQAEDVVAILAGLVDQDDRLDVARGAAGAIVTLLAFHGRTRSAEALRVARAYGDHLIAQVQSLEYGLGWAIPPFGARPLTGLGHGAGGIAWALLELAAATGDARYRTAAQRAHAQERGFDAGTGEDRSGPPVHEVAAAVETGLARLGALRWVDDPWLRAELQADVSAARTWEIGQPHSLAQGAMGCLDLLLLSHQRTPGDPPRAWLDHLTALALASGERDGWLCGGPQGVEMPGLMLGLSGIGYQMLRLAEPERVSSVAALAPPSW